MRLMSHALANVSIISASSPPYPDKETSERHQPTGPDPLGIRAPGRSTNRNEEYIGCRT